MHFPRSLTVAARASNLSRAQVKEVLAELRKSYPEICFETTFLKTTGDKDKKTSLQTLGKTDFFTKEVDEMQVEGKCRITIHSAKDLPDPLHDQLEIAAITKGVDSSDVLVHRNDPIHTIATSSKKRSEEAKKLYPEAKIVDLRGTIEERLCLVREKKVDAVVMAKAALIRLNIDDLPYFHLTSETTPYQGQLAICCRLNDREILDLFLPLDTRPRMLYFGLEKPKSVEKRIDHLPLIETKMRLAPLCSKTVEKTTHIIVTSKTAVGYLFKKAPCQKKSFIAVGKKTAQELKKYGVTDIEIAEDESQEGIISLLQKKDRRKNHYFWPHSNLSRKKLVQFLENESFSFSTHILYDTTFKEPGTVVDFDLYDELYFSSPSTLEAFYSFFGDLPEGKIVTCQGHVTLEKLLQRSNYDKVYTA